MSENIARYDPNVSYNLAVHALRLEKCKTSTPPNEPEFPEIQKNTETKDPFILIKTPFIKIKA